MKQPMAMRVRIGRVVCALVLGLCSAGALAAEAENGAGRTIRVAHVGNSHSHALYLIEHLAKAVGHGHEIGKVNILGSPLRWTWAHPEQCHYPEVLAASKRWDAITLLAWDGEDEVFAPKFAELAYAGNPDCDVLIYTIWPDGEHNWDAPPATRLESHTEKVAAAVQRAFPNRPKPRVVPSSLLMRELGRLADRGELPGVANRFALHSDGGHLSKVGMYAVDVLLCAMLYRESPLEYPSEFGARGRDGTLVDGWYDSISIAPETARIIKLTAWDILLTYPPAGMATQLAIADRTLAPALAGRRYEKRLTAINASAAARWSVAEGSLPEGVSLSPDGVLSGTVARAGAYPVNLAIADGASTFRRRVVLRVDEDKAPVVREAGLPGVRLDEHCFLELKADGGVGDLSWAVAGGRLPRGARLSPAGVLSGTPAEEGQFDFTVRVTDTHPDQPRSAERAMSWKIGPADPSTLRVRQVKLAQRAESSTVVSIDGKLDEPVWNLREPVARLAGGKPACKAAFDAFWLADSSGRARSLCVAVRVAHGPGGKTPKDAVRLYIDGRHNKETMYNHDDAHIVVPREGAARLVRGHTPWWFMKSKTSQTSDGYVVEIEIGDAFFKGKGITTPFAMHSVYGFDIAVEDGTEGSVGRLTWRGDAGIDENTRSFGTIILLEAAPAEPARGR